MPDYQEGKIYTIRSHQTNKYYIGSTTQPLAKRLFGHKSNYSKYMEGKFKSNLTSFEIIKLNDYYIELFENYPCNSKNELDKREGELIRLHKNECVNIVIPCRTKKQYTLDTKDIKREYDRNYREVNKDKKQECNRNYRENNKDKIKERKTLLINCVCGSIIQHKHKASHLKTIKHKNYINSL